MRWSRLALFAVALPCTLSQPLAQAAPPGLWPTGAAAGDGSCSDGSAASKLASSCAAQSPAWISLVYGGTTYCLPPASWINDASYDTGQEWADGIYAAFCSGSATPVCDLDCWPGLFHTEEGFGELYFAWVKYSLTDRTGGLYPSVSGTYCAALGAVVAELSATQYADLSAITGKSIGQIKVEIAAAWMAGWAADWSSQPGGGFCGQVLTCLGDGGALGFPVSPAQLDEIKAADPSSLAGCGDLCNDPAGAPPPRWSGASLGVEQDGDGVPATCADLSTFVANCTSCYPAPGTSGAMQRSDLVALISEFIIAAGASHDCTVLIDCAQGLLTDYFPSDGPMDASELAAFTGSVVGCGVSLPFPDDGVEASGTSYDRNLLEACGSGFGGPDACMNAIPPMMCAPVDLRNGDKLERETDLAVPVTGGTFRMFRTYRSEAAWRSPTLSGAKWALSPFEFTTVSSNRLTMARGTGLAAMPGLNVGSGATLNTLGNTVTLDGPTHQTVTTTQVCIDGVVLPVYRLRDPGRWEIDFLRAKASGESTLGGLSCGSGSTPPVTDPAAALRGLPIQRRDLYGNVQTYEYLVFTSGSRSAARLSRLYLNGTPGGTAPDAEVWFNWILDSGSPEQGRLRSAQVVRWLGTTPTAVPVAKVEYTYFGDLTSPSPDLGQDGDLVQVVTSERVDPAPGSTSDTPAWYRRVTQYRYHDGAGASAGVTAGGRPFTWQGEAHQLKMVLAPEQIEYVAQSLTAGTAATRLDLAAAQLLTQDDGDVAIASGALVVDLASKIVPTYESSGRFRVLTEYSQAACGCGGGSGGGSPQTKRHSFTYWSTTNPSRWTTVVLEESGSGSTWTANKTSYFDMEPAGPTPTSSLYTPPVLVNHAVTDGTRTWVTHHTYATGTTGLRTETCTPEALASGGYTPATSTTAASYTASTSAGAIYTFSYSSDKRLEETRVKKGTSGSAYLLSKTSWGNGSGSTRTWLPDKVERFRTEVTSTGAAGVDDIETVEYSYVFHGAPADAIAIVQAKVEWDGAAFNGPGSAGTTSYAYTHEFYDTEGRNDWSRAADDSLTHRTFDAATGQVATLERNAAPPGGGFAGTGGLSGSFVGRKPDGGSLVSTWVYDPLGRVQQATAPTGAITYFRRELRECADQPGLLHLALVSLPHEITAGSSYAGPASIRWVDGSGGEIASWGCAITASSSYTIPSGGASVGGWPLVVTDYSLVTTESQLLSRSSVERNISGMVTSSVQWHDTAGNGAGGGKYTTQYFHDDLGRLSYSINPLGTVTRNTYDVLDRVIKVEVGVSSGGAPSSMSDVTQSIYDGSGSTQGVGNGKLTRLIEHVDGSTTRITDFTYDHRSRLQLTTGPTAPYEVRLYDNLDRVTASALFSSAPGSIPADFNSADTTRLTLRRTRFSQRGLVATAETAIDPAVASGSQAFLATNNWYDEVGRTVGMWSPNGPGTKTTYDGLGRPITQFVTDRGGDTAPAPGNASHTSVYSNHAAVLTGDNVLEQREYHYIASSGLLDLTRLRQRLHDAAATGAMADGTLTGATSVTTYQGSYFDDAGRLEYSVNFGTNDSGHQFIKGTGDPTVTQGSSPASSASQLVTKTVYDARGLVGSTIDPMGHRTRTFHDALGRTIATAEADDDGSVAITWSSGAWAVSGASTSPGLDRVNSYVYDGLGHVTTLTAHVTGGTDQVTTYSYGVSGTAIGPGTSGAHTVSSGLSSNDLLASIEYPPGSTSTTAAERTVWYGYNRQGEITGTVDQNDTLHTYTRDGAGRVTRDLAALASGSPIDTFMDRVDVVFDSAGRVSKVTGLAHNSGGTPTVRNEVEYTYTPLWQVAGVYQSSTGSVTYDGSGIPTNGSDTRLVSCTYGDAAVGSGNFSRITALGYPRRANSSGVTPETLDTGYGASSGIDDLISRVRTLGLNLSGSAADIVEYTYLGLGTPVVVDYPGSVDVQLDRTLSPNGKRAAAGYATQTAGLYPGFDQFGRVKYQTWADGGLTSTGTPAHPTRPEVVSIEYGYDYSSNRTFAYDTRFQSGWPMNHAYANDPLNRLTAAMRNTRANLTGGTPTNGPGSQAWSLDLLGNWSDVSTWDSTPTQQTESRTHDTVNELLTRNLPGSAPDHTLTYDDAGNLASDAISGGATTTYTHDAWNRLVKVSVGGTAILEQQFNGLGWRTLNRSDTNANGSVDEERTYAYTPGWQLLEERVDSNFSGSPGLDKRVQYAWGLRYIDDCILHRADLNNDGDYADTNEGTWYHLTDAMFSTVALVDLAGAVTERVTYDSYGQARHHFGADIDGNGAVDGADLGVVTGLWGKTVSDATYRSEADLNRDGTIDGGDMGIVLNYRSALPTGQISDSAAGGPDNVIGWDGYVFNATTADYLVRHRTYLPPLGRWAERDPLGYEDGLDLYECVASMPLGVHDPTGTGLQVDPRTPRGFREKVEQCLKRLCPGSTVDASGQVHLPENDADGTTSIVNPPACPGTNCAEVDCTKPPGCAMLRALVRSGVTIGLLGRVKEDQYRTATKRVHLSWDRVPLLNRPFDRARGRFKRGPLVAQDFSPCEALWHELTHAWRDANHLLHSRDGRPLGDDRLGQAWEEIETIRHVNRALNPWVNCCGGDDGPWVWRDPRGHYLVREATDGIYDDPPRGPRGEPLRPPNQILPPVLDPREITDEP